MKNKFLIGDVVGLIGTNNTYTVEGVFYRSTNTDYYYYIVCGTSFREDYLELIQATSSSPELDFQLGEKVGSSSIRGIRDVKSGKNYLVKRKHKKLQMTFLENLSKTLIALGSTQGFIPHLTITKAKEFLGIEETELDLDF